MKRAAIYTLGCRLNQAESALIAGSVRHAGYNLVPFHEDADLAIINTCTVTGEADAKSRKAIRGFIRRNPEAFVAVIGCYSQVAAKKLAQIPGVDLIIGNKEKLRVMDYVGHGKNASAVVVCGPPGNGVFRIAPGTDNERLTRRMNLKIQEGCDVLCSYCIVPRARGGPGSRDFDDAVNEARALASRGAKELVLTGVNVGAYRYQERGLLELVDALNGIEGLERIRVSSIELKTIDPGLASRMNDSAHKLAPFFHIPLQSGSDDILARMRRNYRIGEFESFVKTACEEVADLCIGTDIMVGFPGETEKDFAETCRVLAENPIAYAHVFKYSDRQDTAASKMPGKLDPATLQDRSEEARRISGEKWKAFCENYLGRTVRVLFEEQESGMWTGYTGNYIRVVVCSERNLQNESADVTLERISGELMTGKLDE